MASPGENEPPVPGTSSEHLVAKEEKEDVPHQDTGVNPEKRKYEESDEDSNSSSKRSKQYPVKRSSNSSSNSHPHEEGELFEDYGAESKRVSNKLKLIMDQLDYDESYYRNTPKSYKSRSKNYRTSGSHTGSHSYRGLEEEQDNSRHSKSKSEKALEELQKKVENATTSLKLTSTTMINWMKNEEKSKQKVCNMQEKMISEMKDLRQSLTTIEAKMSKEADTAKTGNIEDSHQEIDQLNPNPDFYKNRVKELEEQLKESSAREEKLHTEVYYWKRQYENSRETIDLTTDDNPSAQEMNQGVITPVELPVLHFQEPQKKKKNKKKRKNLPTASGRSAYDMNVNQNLGLVQNLVPNPVPNMPCIQS